MTAKQEIQLFKDEADLRQVLAGEYMKQIKNYFGDDKRALKFLSGVVSDFQKNPKLKECTPVSIINSFMTMAQLELMPSDISGEAYVIPYGNSRKVGGQWEKIMEAQFQLGYQGLVTLFYRAGAKSIVAELVFEKDEFEILNGEIRHKPDVFADDRGAVKGAYVVITLGNGGVVSKAMSKREILEIGETFSKSFSSEHSPWDPKNDPQGWMLKKTVLKQCAKLVPKNDSIVKAIAEDNKDSVIADKQAAAEEGARGLPPPPMEPYEVQRKDPVAEDEAGGSGAKVEERHEEATGVQDGVQEVPKQADPKVQRMEISNLLKKKHRFTTLGKSDEEVEGKVMDVTGIAYIPENYQAIIQELSESSPSGIKYGR